MIFFDPDTEPETNHSGRYSENRYSIDLPNLPPVEQRPFLPQDTAQQIKVMLDNNGISTPNRPLHFDEGNKTEFSQSFRDLLLTYLVEEGVVCQKQYHPGLIVGETDVRVVRHIARRNYYKKYAKNDVFKVLSPEVLVLRDGEWQIDSEPRLGTGTAKGGVPHTEVVITTSILLDDIYQARTTNVYYINDPDSWHYQELRKLQPPPEKKLSTLTVSDQF